MKSFRDLITVSNAYLLFVESLSKGTRTFINNPKVGEAMDLLEQSLKETVEKHSEEITEAYEVYEAATKGQTKEEWKEEKEKESKEREERFEEMKKNYEEFDKTMNDITNLFKKKEH